MCQALVWFWGCDGKQEYHVLVLRALMVVGEQETRGGHPWHGVWHTKECRGGMERRQ